MEPKVQEMLEYAAKRVREHEAKGGVGVSPWVQAVWLAIKTLLDALLKSG